MAFIAKSYLPLLRSVSHSPIGLRCLWTKCEVHAKVLVIDNTYRRKIVAKSFYNNNYKDEDSYSYSGPGIAAFVGVGLAFGTVLFLQPNIFAKSKNKGESSSSDDSKDSSKDLSSKEITGLPTYTSAEVSTHKSKKKEMWVSYQCGVYDITEFVDIHPGGDQILAAVGGPLEPFWELFSVHKSPQILSILEEYRIGNLKASDRRGQTKSNPDPYLNDPFRNSSLIPRSIKPFNAETPHSLLVENFLTPNSLFYVRNHLPVPVVDIKAYKIEISGIGMSPIFLTMHDLKTKFPKHTITATIQCAGNRRSELNKIKEVKGLDWTAGAIGTATWTGVKLLDVLKFAKVDLENPRLQHIQFKGLDTDNSKKPYGASILFNKVFSDVLLAYKMNGKELPRDHGYPVRVVVPGVVGARNVKWLSKIILSDEESNSHWQKNDYKGFSPSTTWNDVDFNKAPAIQDLPVTSVICKPSAGKTVQLTRGQISVSGYAYSGGGHKIIRVDVSVNGGKTWVVAELAQDESPLDKSWAWTLWHAKIPVPLGTLPGSQLEVICKAVDSSYNVQPDTSAPIWNLRGVLCNSWHRVKVTVK